MAYKLEPLSDNFLFNFKVQMEKTIDRGVIKGIYNRVVNENLKVRVPPLGNVYFYNKETTVKEFESLQIEKGVVSDVLSIMFTYANHFSKINIKQVPVFKWKGNYKYKAGNYIDTNYVKVATIVSNVIMGVADLKEKGTLDGITPIKQNVLILKKDKIEKNYKQFEEFVYIALNHKVLDEQFGAKDMNTMLNLTLSCFIEGV